jgi:hypothetical protein
MPKDSETVTEIVEQTFTVPWEVHERIEPASEVYVLQGGYVLTEAAFMRLTDKPWVWRLVGGLGTGTLLLLVACLAFVLAGKNDWARLKVVEALVAGVATGGLALFASLSGSDHDELVDDIRRTFARRKGRIYLPSRE